MEIGIFVIRAVVGLTLASHGAQKLFGLFGGRGLGGTAAAFESIGFRPGLFFAILAGLGETVGGLALALGLVTPLAAAVIIATMLVAIGSVHVSKGFFIETGGYEYVLLIATVVAGVAFTGPGALSLDHALGFSFGGTGAGLLALGLGVVGALLPLLFRQFQLSRSPAQKTV